MIERTYFDGAVIQISTRNIEDIRGCLCPVDFPVLGFVPNRVFLINAASDAVRGGHGHKLAQQLLMLVSGEIEVELRHKDFVETVFLNERNRLLLIKPMVWAKQKYSKEESSLMVFSDKPYDRSDYFYLNDLQAEDYIAE